MSPEQQRERAYQMFIVFLLFMVATLVADIGFLVAKHGGLQ